MKFMIFWEHVREDSDKLIPKFQRWMEGLKKSPEQHAKQIFPPHYLSQPTETGNMKGMSIYEAVDEEKLIDYIMSFYPEMRIKIIPLLDAAKNVELYLKTKK